MANLARLSVSIGADPTPLMSGVKRAQSALRGFDGSTKNIGKNLSRSFKGAQKPVQGTTMAVTNFNRVVQDAPFGIMGVANNLEPMIQSFNSLKSQTGSTGKALKTLLTSAFTGPGALITAVSVASSLAIVFSQRMRGMGDAGKFAKEKLEATSKAVGDLSDKFNSLAEFSLAEEAEREIQNADRAIELANKRIEVQDKLNKATAGTFQLTGEQRKQQERIIEGYEDEINNIDVLINRLGFEETGLKALNKERELAVLRLETLNEAQSESARLGKFVDDIQSESAKTLNAYNAGIEGADENLTSLIGSIKTQIQTFRAAANEGNTALIPVIIALQKELKGLEDAIPEKDIIPDAPIKPEIEFDVPEDIPIPPQTLTFDEFDLRGDNLTGSVADLQSKLKGLRSDQLQASSPEVWESLQLKINAVQGEIDEITGATDEAKKSTEDLGAVGTESFKMMSQGLGNIVGGLIAGRKEALSFKNVLGALLPGILNLLTGGSSGVLGSFVSSIFGGAFAKGGRPPMGKVSVVGEQGPELFVPSTRGTIIPNGIKTSGGGISKGEMLEVMNSLNWVVRGEDIFVTADRGGNKYRR